MLRQPAFPQASRGLSLIELMVALVAGLLVSGAAVALVVSVIKSNAETIRATRLTQELRATAAVMARDLRRARSVTDPIGNVGMDSTKLINQCNPITPASGSGTSASCVTYGYDCTATTAGAFSSGTFAAIGLAGGKVRLVTSNASVPACPTAATGQQISSNIITITALNVTALTTPVDGYTIQLTGRFTNDPSANPLTRSVTQELRIRSAAVN